MWLAESSKKTHLKKESIWSLWEDVENWRKWNFVIEYSYLNGIFKNGTYGSFKTADGPEAVFKTFEIRNCVRNKSFMGRVKLYFCIMDIGHEMQEEDDKLNIRHYIKLQGPLTFHYTKTLGIKMSYKLDNSVEKLIELAGG